MRIIPRFTFPLLVAAVMTSSGCGNYYRVTDPSSGKVYYTRDINHRDGGAISLKDAATGDQVTLQNSQVSKVSKEEFETNRAGNH
jgi:hypothetical protein